jgi:hypothetical protein
MALVYIFTCIITIITIIIIIQLFYWWLITVTSIQVQVLLTRLYYPYNCCCIQVAATGIKQLKLVYTKFCRTEATVSVRSLIVIS